MRKRASLCIPGIFFALLAFLPTTAFTQSDLADQAVAKARAGDTDAALQLFAKVLAERPNDIAVLRDYAVVLGWAGKYQEAIAAIKKVQSLDNNPPDWALREFAAAYLFGDAKTEAAQPLTSCHLVIHSE